QHDVTRHAANHLALMLVLLEAAISLHGGADDRGTRRHRGTDEAGNGRCRQVLEPVETDASGPVFGRQLHRADDQQFADMAAALAARRRGVLGPGWGLPLLP